LKLLKQFTHKKADDLLEFEKSRDDAGMDESWPYLMVEDIMHYFLFEHLTDAAADLVDSCGTEGISMWKLLNEYYTSLHPTPRTVRCMQRSTPWRA